MCFSSLLTDKSCKGKYVFKITLRTVITCNTMQKKIQYNTITLLNLHRKTKQPFTVFYLTALSHLRDLLSTFNRKLGESSHWLSTLWFSREIFDGAKVHTLKNALCVVLQMRKSLEVCPLFKLFSIDNNGLVLWKLDFCLSVQFFDVFVQGVLLQPELA